MHVRTAVAAAELQLQQIQQLLLQPPCAHAFINVQKRSCRFENHERKRAGTGGPWSKHFTAQNHNTTPLSSQIIAGASWAREAEGVGAILALMRVRGKRKESANTSECKQRKNMAHLRNEMLQTICEEQGAPIGG